jgi:hypothetical protein
MDAPTYTEKRSFRRFPVAVPLSYRNTSSNNIAHCKTQNLCSIGLCIQTFVEMPLNSQVDVCFEVAINNEMTYRRGTVIWTRQIEPNRFRCGIKFDPQINPIPLVLSTLMGRSPATPASPP